jgi:hypothetical protein
MASRLAEVKARRPRAGAWSATQPVHCWETGCGHGGEGDGTGEQKTPQAGAFGKKISWQRPTFPRENPQ